MNSWPFYELQRQVEYKARWNGLSVKYVKAHGTSSRCSVCGGMTNPEEQMVHCARCGIGVGMDVNASANILNRGAALARGARVAPDGAAGEAMVPVQTRKVDAAQLTSCVVNA